jgi:hypothetical protein
MITIDSVQKSHKNINVSKSPELRALISERLYWNRRESKVPNMSSSILSVTVLVSVVAGPVPLWLKASFTLFVLILVPVYWKQYGPGNFLWFSDIALLLTVPALWMESSLLASMVLISSGLLELLWVLDFLIHLTLGVSVIGLSAYMFHSEIRLSIRALSLFHIALPIITVWLVFRLGYDGRALPAQSVLAWIVLPMSYLLTKRSENVNWVYGFGSEPKRWMSSRLHLALLMLLFPIVIYLPTHLLLSVVFGRP